MNNYCKGAFVAVIAAAFVCAWAVPAQAQVACGDVLHVPADYNCELGPYTETLTEDLQCTGTALLVFNDSVCSMVVDCNGHKITSAPIAALDVGVVLEGSLITLKNCVIENFQGVGIKMTGTAVVLVENNTVSSDIDGATAMSINGDEKSIVRTNTLQANIGVHSENMTFTELYNNIVGPIILPGINPSDSMFLHHLEMARMNIVGGNDTGALVQVPGKQESIIVNVFPSDLSGIVKSGIKPEVILVSGTDHFKLDQTMSKKDLTKGTYLMNIVYGGKTERVLFSIK